VSLELAQEPRGDEVAVGEIALEPGQVDAVVGEAADRAAQRGGRVADLEQQRRQRPPGGRGRAGRGRRQDVEPCHVARVVLDPLAQDRQAVERGGLARGDHRLARIAALRDPGGRHGRVRVLDRDQAVVGDERPGLAQRHGVRGDRAHVLQPGARRGGQVQGDALEMLADDRQAAFRQQQMDVGHAPRNEVFARQQRGIGLPRPHGGERRFDRVEARGRSTRQRRPAGQVGEGPGPAVIGHPRATVRRPGPAFRYGRIARPRRERGRGRSDRGGAAGQDDVLGEPADGPGGGVEKTRRLVGHGVTHGPREGSS